MAVSYTHLDVYKRQLQTIAQCQKNGGTAAFIDAEHALDPIYAAKLGVNVDDLLLSQPDTCLLYTSRCV